MNQITPFVTIILSWTIISCPLVLSAAGLWKKNSKLLYFAAAFSVPMSLYIAAAPALSFWPLSFPFLIVTAGIIAKKQRRIYVLGLIAPYWLIFVWLAYAVLVLDSSRQSVDPAYSWSAKP